MVKINFILQRRIKEIYRTQWDFANIAGEPETYVSRVINGRHELTEERKRHWAKLLSCKVEDIF